MVVYLLEKKETLKHYCTNSEFCPPQIIGKFEHFIGRKAMNIDSLGSETIDLLIKKKLVSIVSDLYLLKIEDLLPLKKDGRKWAENILYGINQSKNVSFERVLFALGIRYVGETVSKKLTGYFGTIDNLMNANYQELILVDEIGAKIAESLVNYFNDKKNNILINNLKSHNLCFVSDNENKILSDKAVQVVQ